MQRYNEPKIFSDIQGLVGSEIPSLVANESTGQLELPPAVAEKLKTGAAFGEQVGGDGFAKAVSAHISELQAPVDRLTEMEVRAQSAFLHMSANDFF